jgi:DNA-binding HxlR family transcriptional regulator
VRDLIGGKKRYSELQRSLSGISPRLLAARLRLLEQHRILTRTVFPTIPPTTEYELTTLGDGLCEVIEAMARFGGKLA